MTRSPARSCGAATALRGQRRRPRLRTLALRWHRRRDTDGPRPRPGNRIPPGDGEVVVWTAMREGLMKPARVALVAFTLSLLAVSTVLAAPKGKKHDPEATKALLAAA